jgi:hypothetical protein
MLTREAGRATVILVVAMAAMLPPVAFAEETGEVPGACSPCWFTGLGVAMRGGYAFQESALGRDWFDGGLVGPELLGEIIVYDIHKIMLTVGYFKLFTYQSKGSEEIWTTADYQLVDLAAGYDIRWRLLVAGVRVGGAWTIVTTKTSMGEPGWYVEDEELFFTPPEDPEVSEHTGATFGLLAGLGFGLALGDAVFGIEDLVEIRAQADYLRRGERDDFTVYGSVVFWPTRLF